MLLVACVVVYVYYDYKLNGLCDNKFLYPSTDTVDILLLPADITALVILLFFVECVGYYCYYPPKEFFKELIPLVLLLFEAVIRSEFKFNFKSN